jgi:hypothetical protein
MASYRLAQALKIKNRQVKRFNETQRRIPSQNVHQEVVESKFDIDELWSQLREQAASLTATFESIRQTLSLNS